MPKDARIRNRLADDCRTQVRLLSSELEHYRSELWPGEIDLLKQVIKTATALADRIEKNDKLNPASAA
jgi:transcriptional regulator of acetoin/glycerol metabolism